MKKLIALLVCFVMVFSLSACGSSDSNAGNGDNIANTTVENDKDGNGIYDYTVYALNGDPGDLLPWNIVLKQKEPIYYGIWETLYDFIGGEYVPHCAIGAPVEVDATHWDVTIYDYIYDINGNNITADDVVWCYNRFIEAGYTQKFNAYESVEAIDTYTVRFTWAYEPTGVRELERPLCYVPIYCAAEFDETTFATEPVTTGMYKVENFIAGSGCTLIRRDDYWQTDESLRNPFQQANVDRIDYKVITESSQSLIALQNGEIDWSNNIPDENWEDFDGSTGYQMHLFESTDFSILVANQSEGSPLADKDLRLALYYAIDNEAIASAFFGRIACRSIGSSSCPDYIDSWSTTPNYINTYDPDLAKEYLEKSSYTGETLTLRTANIEEYTTLASIIQIYLENIGIKTKIETLDESTLIAEMNTNGIWDISLMRSGGSFWIKGVNKLMNNIEYNGEFCLGFIYDETLQDLFMVANNENGWTEENCTAVLNYDLENAYHYSIFSAATPSVVTTDVTDVFVLYDCVTLPFASTYNLD